jgi:MFS family permease
MIAFNVGRERRGTAFGIAAAAQALGFMVGPMTAAMFTAISLKAGFLTVSGLLLALTVVIRLAVREPKMNE